MRRSLPLPGWARAVGLYLCLTQTVLSTVLPNSTWLESILDTYRNKNEEWWRERSRGKRAITEGDMHLILDLHNKLRGQVHPPASNMEYMVSTEDITGDKKCSWRAINKSLLWQFTQPEPKQPLLDAAGLRSFVRLRVLEAACMMPEENGELLFKHFWGQKPPSPIISKSDWLLSTIVDRRGRKLIGLY